MVSFKTRRKRLGLKRQDLATLAGVSTSTLWRIEENKVDPSPLVARAINEALAIREALAKTEVAQ
jgi:DNA-binding XRE family transcriptional regulator